MDRAKARKATDKEKRMRISDDLLLEITQVVGIFVLAFMVLVRMFL